MSQDEFEKFDEEELLKSFDTEEEEESLAVADTEEDETVEVSEDSELASFESAEIEEKEELLEDQVMSVIESVLFATDRPQSIALIKQAFRGTTVNTQDIKRAIEKLKIQYADMSRGFCLEEINSGFQLRTKPENMRYLKQMVKTKPFKLSGPALEVLSIVAYKQPCIKSAIDEIRGVESGHLLRGLMERGMVTFEGKSELPGKPMLYGTTRKFLEIFSLRNIKELPSLSEIDELIPEGFGEVEEKETLDKITESMSQDHKSVSYSEGEEELLDITGQLSQITTSSEFFEQEKQKMREKRDRERAQDIRDAMTVGEAVDEKDVNWLTRYESNLAQQNPETHNDLSEL